MVPDLVLISKQAFGKLTAEQQKAMLEAGREAEVKQQEYWNAFVGKTVEELKNQKREVQRSGCRTFRQGSTARVGRLQVKFGTELVRSHHSGEQVE